MKASRIQPGLRIKRGEKIALCEYCAFFYAYTPGETAEEYGLRCPACMIVGVVNMMAGDGEICIKRVDATHIQYGQGEQ